MKGPIPLPELVITFERTTAARSKNSAEIVTEDRPSNVVDMTEGFKARSIIITNATAPDDPEE
jgi:hypothetical protein